MVYGIISTGAFSSATCFDGKQNQREEAADCGGPCVSCEIKRLRPIEGQVKIFGIDGNTNAVLVLSNPNINYGAAVLRYTVNFKSQAGETTLSLTRNSFLYPAEFQKMIVEPNLRLRVGDIEGDPELLIEVINWRPAAEFIQPKTQTRQVEMQLAGNQVNISGLMGNRESFEFSRAVINALIVNKITRVPVGASKTVLLDIKPFEERAFKISALINTPLKVSDLELILSVEAQR